MASSPVDRLVTLPEGLPERTLGYGAALWAIQHLVQPNGPRAGKPWEPTPSQLKFLLWWYAVDENGKWLYHHGVRRLSKGSGKSPMAAVVALMEFCAPVRLKDFDAKVRGGCVGRPQPMPLVQIAATTLDQTTNTMRMVRAFAPKGSKVVDRCHLDPGKVKYYKVPEGTLEVITSSSTAAEGAEASFIVGDETEHWTPNRSGPELAATLLDNLSKSGSRMLETSNAWIPGEDSVAEGSYGDWIAQEEGRYRGDTQILYDARIAPADTDMADEASLRKALEFVYDDCFWQADNIPAIMNRIWAPSARPDESRRKYLNRPTAPLDAWVTFEAWSVLGKPDRVVEPGESIALFFDGSRSRDATALVGCCVSDGHVFVLDAWEPDTAHTTEDVVPVAEVDLAVELAFNRYDVRAFFADVKEWESFAKVTWPQRYGDDLDVWAVPGGKDPQPIAWDMRGHSYEFAQQVELVENEITQGLFTHDGDSRLSRHVSNARRSIYKGLVTIRKESKDSPKKIDLAVAMVGARMVRTLAANANGKKQRSGVIW